MCDNILLLPQPWTNIRDLAQYQDPEVARVAASELDLVGGRGESKVESVRRKLVEQFRNV